MKQILLLGGRSAEKSKRLEDLDLELIRQFSSSLSDLKSGKFKTLS